MPAVWAIPLEGREHAKDIVWKHAMGGLKRGEMRVKLCNKEYMGHTHFINELSIKVEIKI